MARKLTIVLVVLLGLLALGSSSPLFEDGRSFADDEEAAEAFQEEAARYFEEEEARAFEEKVARAYEKTVEELSQLQETRVSLNFIGLLASR